jgi:type III pantothenate kinase
MTSFLSKARSNLLNSLPVQGRTRQEAVIRIVADLGNTRLKLSRLRADGRVERAVSLPVHEPSTWEQYIPDRSSWAIASVNPPVAERLAELLKARNVQQVRWFCSGADVPVPHGLETPESTGADRALAVRAAIVRADMGRSGQVVLCGTAVAIELVSAEGIWLGGAISPGLGLAGRALHTLTAQLPEVGPPSEPQAWGAATRTALEAGIYWGVVGAIREILARQAIVLGSDPWVVWTGGDAQELATSVQGNQARIIPDLVLHGLADLAFS